MDLHPPREFKRPETLMDLIVRQGISSSASGKSLYIDLLDADETPESFLNVIEEGRRRDRIVAVP